MTARTSRKRGDLSFTAYSGAGEIPEDFASAAVVRAGRREGDDGHRRPAAGRVRLLLLLAALVVTLSLAWQQYGSHVSTMMAERFSLPSLQFPETWLPEGPLLDRPFRSVRIETPLTRVREDEIRSILAGHLDGGFFSLDVEGLKTELEAHPWVSRAAVGRMWPDELTVAVHEHRPIARWGEDALINLQGEIFGVGDLRDAASLPKLKGPSESPVAVMQQYQQFSQALQPAALRISALTLEARGGWRLALDNDIRINVGREALMERLQRFVLLYQQEWRRDERSIESVDLRYANGLAVRFGQSAGEAVVALSQGDSFE